jgi:hypothetical protein
MKTRTGIRAAGFLALLILTLAILFGATSAARAQGVQVDLTTACAGDSCYNWSGLFSAGTTFWGTPGMDNGQNCTPISGQTLCPAAESAQQLGLSSSTPPTLTPPSVGVLFNFGPINASPCGPVAGTACTEDMINVPTGAGVTVTAAVNVYSQLIILGTAVNGFHGQHAGVVTINYTSGSPDVIQQNYSEWCNYQKNANETVAVTGERIIASGGIISPVCNLYAYTYNLDTSREVQSFNLTETDSFNENYVMAVSFKPPSYVIEGGTASPASVSPGSSSTATVTVDPQLGYTGTVNLACSISPTITGEPTSAATPPTCSVSPTSVTVTATESAPPTTQLTFTAASPTTSGLKKPSKILYALWLCVPGLVFLGVGSSKSRRRALGLWMLGLLLLTIFFAPGCVSYTHLGNVGTPPGQYTVTITGQDASTGATQAGNPAGTTNTVVVTVTE